jgi:hypothetical protein
MDYRNADGSIAEMCGNGIRVFARYLIDHGLTAGSELAIATRSGVRSVRQEADGALTVDMGPAQVGRAGWAVLGGRRYTGVTVAVGNPHLVCVVTKALSGIDLTEPPEVDAAAFPDGVNVEVVRVTGDDAIERRGEERGSGEALSGGTAQIAANRGQGEGLDPADSVRPLADSWPTYSGDYSGKRYSSLTQINQSNVKNLSLAWVSRVTAGPGAGGGAGPRPDNPAAGAPTIVGGEGTAIAGGATNIRGAVLAVNGILYFTTPDNAWAIDARDGREIWHFFWKTRGGTHIGNRGVGMWGSYLFMETPDDYLVSLDARTGKERWHKEIASFVQEYFSTMAPIVIGNHVLVGTGNDLDAPGFLQSFDPETGELQWKLYTVPMKEGDPGLETWKNLDAARHGGAQVLAARHARLGFRADASARRRAVQRPDAKAGAHRRPERVLLHARSRHG